MPVETLILNALSNTDRRLQQGKSVTPAFLFAAFLWYPMTQRMQKLQDEDGMHPLPALHEAANQVIAAQVRQTAIPRRFSTPIREIWELQLRLSRRQGKRADRLMGTPAVPCSLRPAGCYVRTVAKTLMVWVNGGPAIRTVIRATVWK